MLRRLFALEVFASATSGTRSQSLLSRRAPGRSAFGGDVSRPVHEGVPGDWLMKAERRAKLPKLERGRFHPYRRLFATGRKHLPDVDVAEAAGWRDLQTMKRSYQQPDPATVLEVVESAPGGHTSATPPSAERE